MSEACLFCRIISGETLAHKLLEDEHACAFLDAYPLAPGHVLVVPKTHVERLEELAEADASGLFRAVWLVNRAVIRAMSAYGSTVGINNGRVAGQVVPHVHVHVIPRFKADRAGSVHTLDWPRPSIPGHEMARIARSIAEALAVPFKSQSPG